MILIETPLDHTTDRFDVYDSDGLIESCVSLNKALDVVTYLLAYENRLPTDGTYGQVAERSVLTTLRLSWDEGDPIPEPEDLASDLREPAEPHGFAITPMVGAWEGKVEYGYVVSITTPTDAPEIIGRILNRLATAYPELDWAHVETTTPAIEYVDLKERR